MGWMDQVSSLLQQYAASGTGTASSDAGDHFDKVAQVAPQGAIADGLAAAFRSDKTAPFGQMLAQLFSQSNGTQQAGMLNQLIAAAGPSVLQQAMSGASGGTLGGALSAMLAPQPGAGQANVTPAQAQQVLPQQVQQLAAQVEKSNPSVIDAMSQFYAQHPEVVKSLGAGALSIALAKIAQGQGRT